MLTLHFWHRYLGAVDKLGLQPAECALVAAHLNDLVAARSCGLRTIYVERVREEDASTHDVEAARSWVDIWIPLSEQGFNSVAQRLGVSMVTT
jgi:2-haloacid dehalogenase